VQALNLDRVDVTQRQAVEQARAVEQGAERLIVALPKQLQQQILRIFGAAVGVPQGSNFPRAR